MACPSPLRLEGPALRAVLNHFANEVSRAVGPGEVDESLSI